jgi:hypothetical protein
MWRPVIYSVLRKSRQKNVKWKNLDVVELGLFPALGDEAREKGIKPTST